MTALKDGLSTVLTVKITDTKTGKAEYRPVIVDCINNENVRIEVFANDRRCTKVYDSSPI